MGRRTTRRKPLGTLWEIPDALWERMANIEATSAAGIIVKLRIAFYQTPVFTRNSPALAILAEQEPSGRLLWGQGNVPGAPPSPAGLIRTEGTFL